MSSAPKVFTASKFIENSQTTQYTVASALKGTRIDEIIVSNRSGSPATLIVNVVPNGGSAATSNELFPLKTFAAGETYTYPPIWLGPGEFISTLAGTASALVMHMAGREYT
jgi:hypothetical protein